MLSTLNYYLSNALNFFSDYSYKEEEIMKETPSFGAAEWEKFLNLKVEAPEIPENIKMYLETSCPFFPNKTVKETHVLCLVPKGLTLPKLYELAGSKSKSCFLEKGTDCSKESYWILITKQVIPSADKLPFSQQEKIIHQAGYHVPKMLEAAIAVLSVKFLQKVSIFSKPGQFTRCQEKERDWPIAIGNDIAAPFCVCLNDYNELNGIAGVYR